MNTYTIKKAVALTLMTGVFASLVPFGAFAALNDHPLDYPTLQVNNDNVYPASKNWDTSVAANPGDQISFLIYFHNNSTETARNVRVRLTPQTSGSKSTHSFTATVSADNFSSKSQTVTVSISKAKPMEFIPGSVRLFSNQCDADSCSTGLPSGQSESTLFGSGVNLGDIAPGWSTQGSVRLFYVIEAERVSPPTVGISANPSIINRGNSSVLNWNSSNADSCSASNGWSGSKSLSGSQTVSPQNTTTYTITCRNSAGETSRSATVTVENVQENFPTVFITANPFTVTRGNNSVLNWNSSNATSCFASNGWSGSKSLSGSQSVSPGNATTYTITCSNSRGSASDSVTVSVVQGVNPPSLVFSANPFVINRGDSTSLNWSSDNTTSCVAGGGWSGSKSLNGSQIVSPITQTNYTMTCFGPGGQVTASALVTVIQPPVSNVFSTSCVVNKSPAIQGDAVTFTAIPTGGTTPFNYGWSGVVSGSGKSKTATFTTVGTKTATVAVTDADGRVRTANCSVNVQEKPIVVVSTPTCEIQRTLVCSNGKTYKVPASGDVYDENGVLIYSDKNGGSVNNATSTPKDETDEDKSTFASLFLNSDGRLSGIGFLLFWYFLILFTVGVGILAYRVAKNAGTRKIEY